MTDIVNFGVKIPLYATLRGKDGCVIGEVQGWLLSVHDEPDPYAIYLVGDGPDSLGEWVRDTRGWDRDIDFYHRHLMPEAEKPEVLQALADKWWEWRKQQAVSAKADAFWDQQKEPVSP